MLGMMYLLETEEDRICFERMYEKINPQLLHTAYAILHNRYDAEDIVQNVYVKIADNFHKYRGKTFTDMMSLGIVMTRNAAIDLIRKRGRHTEVDFEANAYRSGSEVDMLKGVLCEDNKEECRKIFNRLKPEERDLLTLKYFHEMTYVEIGRMLGIKRKTVDMRLYRIKEKLKRELQGE